MRELLLRAAQRIGMTKEVTSGAVKLLVDSMEGGEPYPLYYCAAQNDHQSTLRLLAAQGADFNARPGDQVGGTVA